MRQLAAEVGGRFLDLAYDPVTCAEDCPWVPKARYHLMKGEMERQGNLGVDLLLLSTTVQVETREAQCAVILVTVIGGCSLDPTCSGLGT